MKGLYDACHDRPERIAEAIKRRVRLHGPHTVFLYHDGELEISPTSRASVARKLETNRDDLVGTFDKTSPIGDVTEAVRDRVWEILRARMRRKAA